MRTYFLALVTGAFLFSCLLPLASANACGETSDCAVETGTYRVRMPESANASNKVGAIVYLHGWQGTPEGVMKFTAMRNMADRLGVALILPRGQGKSWGLPRAFAGRRDDVAFVRSVVDDAITRLPIDRDRIMVTGFSLGGSMTWYIACAEGRRYAGYAPIAGSFWEPYVDNCATPLPDIYHVHGTADRTVPLEGRRLSSATQGDTYKSFSLLRKFSGCNGDLAGKTTEGNLTCSKQSCGGAVQQLCLHDGGHSVKPIWIERAWKKLAKAQGWS